MQIVADVIFDERKLFVREQMGNVFHPSREEIVNADYGVPRLQEYIAQMTPKKPSSACNKDTHETNLLRLSQHECHNN